MKPNESACAKRDCADDEIGTAGVVSSDLPGMVGDIAEIAYHYHRLVKSSNDPCADQIASDSANDGCQGIGSDEEERRPSPKWRLLTQKVVVDAGTRLTFNDACAIISAIRGQEYEISKTCDTCRQSKLLVEFEIDRKTCRECRNHRKNKLRWARLSARKAFEMHTAMARLMNFFDSEEGKEMLLASDRKKQAAASEGQ